MLQTRTLILTALAMLAFAGNSLLCRLALRETSIDAASFTGLRLLAGALTLWLLLRIRQPKTTFSYAREALVSALWLFIYAAAFSFAYLELETGTGALLLFGAVQLTMIILGWLQGERFSARQYMGLSMALGGVLLLLLPSSSTPKLSAAVLMLISGIAWGLYSLKGRTTQDPLAATANSFLISLPLTALLTLLCHEQLQLDASGVLYALLSGALTSAIGYALWYSALRGLAAFQAASVQLSVPVLAALAGALLLDEPLSLQLLLSSAAVLGGIALLLSARAQKTV